MKSILIALIFLHAIIPLSSCDNEEPKPSPQCSCDATNSTAMTSIEGVVVNSTDGWLMLSPREGFVVSCDEVEEKFLIDGLMVILSGTSKARCEIENEYPGMMKHFAKLSTISASSDSLFNGPPGVEIHIIKSEDYGYAQGFGYRIKTEGGFKIFQPMMPAIGGNRVFKSAADAFKIGMLVVYKLENDLHPAISVDDLYYFRVVE